MLLEYWQFYLLSIVALGVECAFNCFAGKIKPLTTSKLKDDKEKCFVSSMPSKMLSMGQALNLQHRGVT
jgi:hypothetical protein